MACCRLRRKAQHDSARPRQSGSRVNSANIDGVLIRRCCATGSAQMNVECSEGRQPVGSEPRHDRAGRVEAVDRQLADCRGDACGFAEP